MKLRKFNSIENSFQSDFITSIYDNGFGDGKYVVQEKVHGANFSFLTNGKDMRMAKRTGIIEENEDFYNCNQIRNKYKPKIIALFKNISKKRNIEQLTVFGEIFGGGYPHENIQKIETATLVQRGIYYNPNNDFLAFDILVDNTEYLTVDGSNKLFKELGFKYAKSLFEGTLNDCLEYPNKFKTKIPEEYGLPELEGNICEGVVIRPIKPLFFNNGSRVILKNKNEKWSENNNYIDKKVLRNLLHKEEELSVNVKILCKEVYKYISVNRLLNVISKIGDIHPKKDFGRILGMFNKDILLDFSKEYKAKYDALDKSESKAVNKFINKHASLLVSKHLAE